MAQWTLYCPQSALLRMSVSLMEPNVMSRPRQLTEIRIVDVSHIAL